MLEWFQLIETPFGGQGTADRQRTEELTTDNFPGGQSAQEFLRTLGLTVDETLIREVVNSLSTGRPLYAFYNGGKHPDGSKRTPKCGKGTAYKIKRLYDKGALRPYLDYLAPPDEALETDASPDDEDEPVPTGFLDIDTQLSGGMGRGELLILAGRSGVGKSILALNIILNAVDAGLSVGFISLEKTSSRAGISMLVSRTNVDAHRLRLGLVSDREQDSVIEAIDKLQSSGIYIENRWEPNVEMIRRKFLSFSRESQLDLVVVDYIQLLEGSAAGETMAEVTEFVTRQLKSMAREINVPVLALSQLGEKQDFFGLRPPSLSDMPVGVGVVAHADVVMLLHRVDTPSTSEPQDNGRVPDQAFQGKVAVDVAKNRHGSKGVVYLYFDEARLRYENLA